MSRSLLPGVLLLGKTGKAIRPTNSNSGVSAVASVTLKKLVEPLKVVNMNNKEYSLMKEIVLFNPGGWVGVSVWCVCVCVCV